jgi:quercetin dioxygenase-like cupin family protein
MKMLNVRVSVSAVALIATVAICSAQSGAFKRTELQRGDLSAQGREVVTAIAEIPAGVESGMHRHPGEEVGYLIEGSINVDMPGKSPMTYKAGQAFLIPAGQPHNARNTGSSTARVLANYIVEKGKPLAEPVKGKS